MRFSCTGERTGKQGRPKTYDGKIDWQDLNRIDRVEASELDYDYDLNCWKNHPAYEELRTYGAITA
jgi:hypothetical protein